MRIIAGEWRGRKLVVGKGLSIRPATDRVREAVFNVLGQDRVEQAAVLDLFAGSGSLGLEALSRGARHLTSVERHARSRQVLGQNLAALGGADRAELVADDAFVWVVRNAGRVAIDLVFLDPPYAVYRDLRRLAKFSKLLADLDGVLAPGGTVVFERGRECPEPTLPAWARVESCRRYGRNVVYFLCRSGALPDALDASTASADPADQRP